MIGIIAGIAAAVAIGSLITHIVLFCIRWLKERIRKLFQKQNVKKVAAAPLEKLIEECPNTTSLDDFLKDGYTDVLATVDNSGQVENVELIKNTGSTDPEIERLYGREDMVVITR